MKKLFAAIIIMIIATSCSSDNAQTDFNENEITIKTPSTARNRSDLEDLFNNMKVTNSYIDFESKASAFVEKMNYDGDLDDIENTDILSWISLNLNKTTFKDYSDAESELEELKISSEKVASENTLFFTTLGNSDENDPAIVPIWFTQPEPSSKNCIKNCWDLYATRLTKLSMLLTKNCNENPSKVGSYMADFSMYRNMLDKGRDACLKGCPK